MRTMKSISNKLASLLLMAGAFTALFATLLLLRMRTALMQQKLQRFQLKLDS